MINKIHKTLLSLIKNNYAFEVYNIDDYNRLIFSFYHLNSVYNGLCYISKESSNIYIDFQYHAHNKRIEKQLNYLCANIYKLYKLNQIDFVAEIITNYKPLMLDKHNTCFSLAEV